MPLASLYATVVSWVGTYAVKLLAAVLVFVIGRWLARRVTGLLVKVLERNRVDAALVGFLESIAYYTLIVVVLIAAAGQVGISVTSFITILGAAGLAVGLALKDSLSNLAAGVMLILFRPFRLGDYISAGGVAGTVQHITMFNTILTTPDNQRLIVPNSAITGGVITNVTANPTRRIELVVGIGYGDDIARAKALVAEILEADARVLADPAPVIAVKELGESSVNLVVRPWATREDYWNLMFDLTERIKLAFDANGITIPFPQRDVHLVQAAPA